MNKSHGVRFIAMLLAAVTLLAGFSFVVSADETTEQDRAENVADLTELLSAIKYSSYLIRHQDVPNADQTVTIDATAFSADDTTAAIGSGEDQVRVVRYADMDGEGNYKAGTEKEGIYCPTNGAVGWKINVPKTGMYSISIEYYPVEGKSSSIERTLYIDGAVPFYEARFLTCSKVWSDEYSDEYNGTRDNSFKQDINGNEIKPGKMQTPSWRTYEFIDSTGFYTDPFQFYLEEGTHVLQLEARREAYAIKSITLHPIENLKSYEDYLNQYSESDYVSAEAIESAQPDGEGVIKIEAELVHQTSDMSIYPKYDKSSAITSPQSSSKIILNSIGGEQQWTTVGQWASWKVTVPKAGLYKIALRFKQGSDAGLFSSRQIKVNGKIPFDEAKYLQFSSGDSWQSAYLNDGSDENAEGFLFYLEEGENIIELEAVFGNMADILVRLNAALSIINRAYIDILMITGTKPDKDTDYNFYKLIPGTIDNLAAMSDELYDIADQLAEISGKSQNTATLETVARLLYKMGHKEDDVAKNLNNLKNNIGTLGTWIQTAMKQPLEIDYIQIQGADSGKKQLPKAKDGFFQSIGFELAQFGLSFTSDFNTLGALEDVPEEDTVVVWTTSGRDQAQIIRTLANNEFTPNTGINVSLKLVAAGSLLPSILAGVGPDVSMDTTSSDVINWAIRDAVIGLNDFEGFDEITSEFPAAALVPLTLYTDDIYGYNAENDGPIPEDRVKATTYALPQTLSFYMMFYRADILQSLGVSVPKTWDDVYALLPILQNNQMQAALPIALAGENLFLYQMKDTNASFRDGLYADNGRRINLDSNVALEAFDELCSMFTQYRLPVTYDFANRFRTGEIPIGIVDYTVYTQLSVFAPEIKGLWDFVPLPGWEDENGNINNTAVATVTGMIMPRGNRTEEKERNAWEYMKWFVSAETQSSYANEYSAVLGSDTKANTANTKALADLPWTTDEYTSLMAQFNHLTAVPEYPGGYIVTRFVESAFMEAYNDNASPVTSMLNRITDINKEISRKREEFDLDFYEISYASNFTESAE
ncbi:MAG: extracellular solute-binding protein [Clostridiales bacterium]|nr:extracellular solute-binding protein [Clostridiales bacterium]